MPFVIVSWIHQHTSSNLTMYMANKKLFLFINQFHITNVKKIKICEVKQSFFIEFPWHSNKTLDEAVIFVL